MAKTNLNGFLRRLTRGMVAETLATESDRQLVEQFLAGHGEAAFEAIVRRHGPMVYRVCWRVLRQEQDTEDAYQAAFLILAQKVRTLRKRASLASWLHGVAYRVAIKAKGEAANRRRHEQEAVESPAGPSDEVTWGELRGVLDSELEGMPEKWRLPLVLCYLEGRTQDEAAKQLGLSERTLRRRMEEARAALGRRLTRRGVALPAALSAILFSECAASAALPARLVGSTVEAAARLAAGQAGTAILSAKVVALAEGVVKTMSLSKLKTIAALLLGAVVIAASVASRGLPVLAANGQPPQSPRIGGRDEPSAAQSADAPKKPSAVEQPATPTGKAVEVSGLVVGPDDKPFAGARLFVVTGGAKKADLKVQATTGADGRFQMQVSRAELERDGRLLATAAGHGPDWVLCQPGAGWPDQVRLRLLKEVPITGRLLNDEGQPLAGIDLQVLSVEKGTDGRDPTPQIYGPQLTNAMVVSKPKTIGISAAALGLPGSVKTGKDGSFRLSGVGRGRLVRLDLRAPNREHADLCVTTSFAGVGSVGAPWGIYGHTFKHLVLPSRPIVGSVRDKRTGKPLAGIAVMAQAAMPALASRFHGDVIGIPARASTDDKGRFWIDGIGKHDFYHLHAGGGPYTYLRPVSPLPPGSPHFGQDKLQVKDTAGLEPLTVDFELDRGVVMRGRLTDEVTGKPVHGWVGSVPLADNPNRKLFGAVGDYVQTAADGSFSFVAMPGPGLLWVRASRLDGLSGPGLNPYELDRYAWMHVHDDSLVRDLAALGWQALYYHAVVRIDPSAKDTEVTLGAIALEPGQTRTVNVVGPDGKPLKGVLPFGLSPLDTYAGRRPLTTANFTAKGLSKRTPRPLLFFHPGTRFSKLEWVKADGEKPLTVRLEPPGTVTGRVVDINGRPLAGLALGVSHWGEVVLNKHIPLAAVTSDLLSLRGTKTDADGKFRLEGLLPALKYHLAIYRRAGAVQLTTGVSVGSDKVKHLGDLKYKEAPNAQKEKEQ